MNDPTPQLMQTHNPSLGNPLRLDSPCQPCSLTDILPYEILVAVLEESDWLDVLRVRTVSRTILAASRERSVWEAICRRHESQRLPNSHFLEKKMTVCTASELEAAFLRPRKSNAAWGTSTHISHRLFYPPLSPHGCMPLLLLPGGRWVIATTRPHWHVVCFDLDACKAPGEPNDQTMLAENPFASEVGRMVILPPNVVIDTAHVSSPYLTFNFAVFFNISRLDDPHGFIRDYYKIVQVWHVEPRYDASGHIVGLGSTLLSSFEIEANGFSLLAGFALSGAYLAYQVALSNFVCVVEWKEVSGRDFERWRMWNPSCVRVDFLFDKSDLILQWTYDEVLICNFKAVPPTKEDDSVCSRSCQRPAWGRRKADVNEWDAWRSIGPFQITDGLVFILYGSTTLRSLIIPRPRHLSGPMTSLPCLEPCGVDESNVDMEHRVSMMGRCKAYGLSKIVQTTKEGNDNIYLQHAYLPWEHQKPELHVPVRYSRIDLPSGLYHNWQGLDEVSSRILSGDTVTAAHPAWVVFEVLGDLESHPQLQ